MAAVLSDILFVGSELISIPKKNKIGDIQVDTTIREIYEDSLEITEHPVEAGAQITDHSFKRPMGLFLHCGWTDSSATALLGALGNLLGIGAGGGASSSGGFVGGAMAASDYVAGVYSQLIQLQESRQPFSITTGLRNYDSMLMTILRVERDHSKRYALFVEAEFQQVIIVSTSTATMAPQANQKNPASTAQTVDAGSQQLQSGATSPGGALPPTKWGPP